MTRDDAIEAGARALWDIDWPDRTGTVGVPEFYRRLAAAVLDAVGWAAPVAYVVAHEDHNPPGWVDPGCWPDLAGARSWAEPGERVWGLVPVELR